MHKYIIIELTYNFKKNKNIKITNKIIKIKEEVAKALEIARAEKVIGHSLNAKVTLYADEKEYEFLIVPLELFKPIKPPKTPPVADISP